MIINEYESENGIIKKETYREEYSVFLNESKKKLEEIAAINEFLYKNRTLAEKLICKLHLDYPTKQQCNRRKQQLHEELKRLNQAEIYYFEEEFDLEKRRDKIKQKKKTNLILK